MTIPNVHRARSVVPATKSFKSSDGDAGVQTYIASMEPWQAAIAKRVDALVVTHVPGVRKAVRWRCPTYGVEGQGWAASIPGWDGGSPRYGGSPL